MPLPRLWGFLIKIRKTKLVDNVSRLRGKISTRAMAQWHWLERRPWLFQIIFLQFLRVWNKIQSKVILNLRSWSDSRFWYGTFQIMILIWSLIEKKWSANSLLPIYHLILDHYSKRVYLTKKIVSSKHIAWICEKQGLKLTNFHFSENMNFTIVLSLFLAVFMAYTVQADQYNVSGTFFSGDC